MRVDFDDCVLGATVVLRVPFLVASFGSDCTAFDIAVLGDGKRENVRNICALSESNEFREFKEFKGNLFTLVEESQQNCILGVFDSTKVSFDSSLRDSFLSNCGALGDPKSRVWAAKVPNYVPQFPICE